jgi:flagellin-like protein
MLRSRKAISPILATLLLIVIAVAATVVTYAWVMTYIGSTTEQAGVLLYKANVNFASGSPKNITLDVGNSGTSNTQIIGVYIGESATTTQNYEPIYVDGYTSSLTAGAITRFNVTIAWSDGTTYYFRIVPAAGQQPLTFQEQAPS